MFAKLKNPVSGLTHLAGAILSLLGMILLLNTSLNPLKPLHIITFSIFGSAMILLYICSSLYHLLPLSTAATLRLRKLDHTMIYIFIAATYTPICLIPLGGVWGWSLFAAVWSFAVAGVLLKFLWFQIPRWFSTVLYTAMGWLVIIGFVPLVDALQRGAILWIALGGLFYTIGSGIYALKRPDPWPDIFGFHEIFHLFVMLGASLFSG